MKPDGVASNLRDIFAWTDWQVQRDLDTLNAPIPLPGPEDAGLELVRLAKAYRRLRRKAPGWRPNHAGNRNHSSIIPALTADLLREAGAIDALHAGMPRTAPTGPTDPPSPVRVGPPGGIAQEGLKAAITRVCGECRQSLEHLGSRAQFCSDTCRKRTRRREDKISTPETPAEAKRHDRMAMGYLASGHCGQCAARAAWARQIDLGPVALCTNCEDINDTKKETAA